MQQSKTEWVPGYSLRIIYQCSKMKKSLKIKTFDQPNQEGALVSALQREIRLLESRLPNLSEAERGRMSMLHYNLVLAGEYAVYDENTVETAMHNTFAKPTAAADDRQAS